MGKSTTSGQTALTEEVLVRELRVFEKHLDHRFDIQTESMKAHINSQIARVQNQMDARFGQVDKRLYQLDQKIEKLDIKLDVRTDGLVQLIERTTS